MKPLLLLFALLFAFSQFAHSQVIEKDVDFSVSPTLIEDGEVQYSLGWHTPNDFRKTNVSIIDEVKVSSIKPNNNQIISGKLIFITEKPYDDFTQAKMNNAEYISYMLNSVSVNKKSSESWSVVNKVRAYNIPFKVSFDFAFKELETSNLPSHILKYFQDESSAFKGTGREKFVTLDMTNFSQLMYRNYSIVYLKEISKGKSLVIAALVTGFDLNSANNFFNFPPFSTTRGTMTANLKTQVFHIVNSIKK